MISSSARPLILCLLMAIALSYSIVERHPDPVATSGSLPEEDAPPKLTLGEASFGITGGDGLGHWFVETALPKTWGLVQRPGHDYEGIIVDAAKVPVAKVRVELHRPTGNTEAESLNRYASERLLSHKPEYKTAVNHEHGYITIDGHRMFRWRMVDSAITDPYYGFPVEFPKRRETAPKSPTGVIVYADRRGSVIAEWVLYTEAARLDNVSALMDTMVSLADYSRRPLDSPSTTP